MGGYDSRQHWSQVKATTAQYCQLDVRLWQRDHLLIPGTAAERLAQDLGESFPIGPSVPKSDPCLCNGAAGLVHYITLKCACQSGGLRR